MGKSTISMAIFNSYMYYKWPFSSIFNSHNMLNMLVITRGHLCWLAKTPPMEWLLSHAISSNGAASDVSAAAFKRFCSCGRSCTPFTHSAWKELMGSKRIANENHPNWYHKNQRVLLCHNIWTIAHGICMMCIHLALKHHISCQARTI